MDKPENPQAFPWSEWRNTSSDPLATPREIKHPGLSMRDWFAGQALAGLARRDTVNRSTRPDAFASAAYAVADAMLLARSRGEG